MLETSAMDNTSSVKDELSGRAGYVAAGTDLLHDLAHTRGDFDYDKMRAGYRAEGCPEDIIEKFIRVLSYRGPTRP